MRILFLLAAVVLFVNSVQAQSSGYRILETLEHNPEYFTQGLELHSGLLYESSGLYGKSSIRKYSPDSDKTLHEVPLAERFFAEGLTVFDDELFVLTWKENTLLVLDPATLGVKRERRYSGEGWGLANDGRQLIMSNGSDTITFRNPESFRIERKIKVHYQQHTLRRINELEFAQGYLWANIWLSPMIIKIDPANGKVVALYDFSGLVEKNTTGNKNSVLNGIAYDAERKAYWITGKRWARRYLVNFAE